MQTTKKVRFGIRKKLFLIVLVGFTALVVAISWRIGVQANKVAGESIARALSQSSVILETKMDSRYASIKEVAIGLARDGRVLPLVFDREALTLQDLSHEFQRVLEFDILFFTDDGGTILARSDRPDAMGQSVAGRSSLFDTALAGKEAQGIIASQDRLLQIVVIPIFDNVAKDIVRGTIALAYELSPEIAREINALTASDIGFFIFGRDENRQIASAESIYNTNNDLGEKLNRYFSARPAAWKSIYDGGHEKKDLELVLNDEDFFAVVHPLAKHDGENLGFVMALQSRTELLKPFLDIQRQVIIVGIIVLLLASVFAWIIALRISRPIVDLVSVTNDIQEGKYPQNPTASKRNDEVGLLYEAVFNMGKNLKEKAELEDYLALLSEDLDQSSVEWEDYGDESSSNATIANEELKEEDKTYVRREDDLHSELTFQRKAGKPADVPGAVERVSGGSVIDGRYEIIKRLGIGAMGEVFLARDIDLDEQIAIKILDKKNFRPEELNQFKEEIRLARRITHRNILRTFDFGVWNKLYYITMEYVPGYDLGQLIDKKGALELHIGVAMAKQVCSAMNAAHEQGIIHRDLKPSNMMINRQGILKIMDFGLAMKISESGEKNDSSSEDGDNSKTTVAGTPKYMAPEQFFGWDLDQRTDIYAIGIIMYAIFSGKPPFNARQFEDFAKLHYKAVAPRLGEKIKSFPEKLDNIIQKALAKNADDRYQSVRALLDDLQLV